MMFAAHVVVEAPMKMKLIQEECVCKVATFQLRCGVYGAVDFVRDYFTIEVTLWWE